MLVVTKYSRKHYNVIGDVESVQKTMNCTHIRQINEFTTQNTEGFKQVHEHQSKNCVGTNINNGHIRQNDGVMRKSHNKAEVIYKNVTEALSFAHIAQNNGHHRQAHKHLTKQQTLQAE